MDIGGIRQVLQLALDNAVEASDDSSVVNVSYRRGIVDGSPAITIIVSDDGPGIPKEDRAKVFEPFYSTKPNGTGLGLAICKRIVSAHSGTIRFEDPLFRGASLYITLPIHRPRATDGPLAG